MPLSSGLRRLVLSGPDTTDVPQMGGHDQGRFLGVVILHGVQEQLMFAA
ncbi:hypothetical protein [Arthrobacter sp. ISL-30]|nr:hypothetical protein [Arthrobacter sp. ISL-30]MBT2512995.1 hypothetical protein [Arthrobacter sp. ISL-30]